MDNDFLPPSRRSNTYMHQRLRPTAPRPQGGFKTPEAIAETERPPLPVPGSVLSGEATGGSNHNDSGKKKNFLERLKRLSKKQWLLIGVAAAVVLGLIGFGVYHLWIKDDPKPVKKAVVKKVAPKPAPVPLVSTLTGLPISDAAINQRPVTAVMIENSPDARPQSGLHQAGVIFEAIAEGGITRFVALYQDSEPDYIGPVRSVRPYYLQWLMGFDAAVAHAGGSGEALSMIKSLGIKDLDHGANGGLYQRVRYRVGPHNLYSNVITMREVQEQRGFKSTYTGFARKAEAKSAAPTATSIDFTISSPLYNPHYDYDAATNSYKRSEGGKPHTDERSGQQLNPKVVIGLIMPQGRNGIYTTYNTLGSGEAFIFQDGILAKGTWHKADNKTQFTFTDATGAPLKLNPGQTWISVMGGSERVISK